MNLYKTFEWKWLGLTYLVISWQREYYSWSHYWLVKNVFFLLFVLSFWYISDLLFPRLTLPLNWHFCFFCTSLPFSVQTVAVRSTQFSVVNAWALLPMLCADFQGDIDDHNHRAVPQHHLQARPQLSRGLRTVCENVKEGEVRLYLTKFFSVQLWVLAVWQKWITQNIFQWGKKGVLFFVSVCCQSHLTLQPVLSLRCPAWVTRSISLTVYAMWQNLGGSQGDSGKVRKTWGRQLWFRALQNFSMFMIELLALQVAKPTWSTWWWWRGSSGSMWPLAKIWWQTWCFISHRYWRIRALQINRLLTFS